MGIISKATLQRLFLLGVLEQFKNGIYGAKRLQKVIYFIEKNTGIQPFGYKKYLHGQYSEELEEIKEQLMSMCYISAIPLDKGQGNKYSLTNKASRFDTILESIFPGSKQKIKSMIKEIGYLSEEDLVELAYQNSNLKKVAFDKTIIKSDLPEKLTIKNLSDEECENIELTLNPNFIHFSTKIKEALDSGKLDIDKVEKIAHLV